MYARRLLLAASALYATTGIFAASALSVGPLNACRSISAMAIPSTPAVAALLNPLAIPPTFGVWGPGPRIGAADRLEGSRGPLWVGVKNGFVVTWLTNVNL